MARHIAEESSPARAVIATTRCSTSSARRGTTVYHPGQHLPMGPDPKAVVDERLAGPRLRAGCA